MSHVVFEGAPMARDTFLEWLTMGHASDAIARLRYRTEPDLPLFSYAQQAAIVNSIRSNQNPGTKLANKKALRETLRVQKREEHAKHVEEQKRKMDMRKAKLEVKMAAAANASLETEGEATSGEIDTENGEAAPAVTGSGEIAPTEADEGEEDADAEKTGLAVTGAAPAQTGNDSDGETDRAEDGHAHMASAENTNGAERENKAG
ncbi:hypothetical protein C8R45DRAFT_96697 [Mycena sanguinolenta]|nr:hypothetical protein C8R45DRAFT_96697 [Mycena sanguinolenta]